MPWHLAHKVAEALRPRIIGLGRIPEAESVRDVQNALFGRPDVVLLAHVAKILGETIPKGSIVYNLEPLFDGCRSLSVGYLDVLREFEVWDYQARNVEYLKEHGISAKHVPYRFSPGLRRAPTVEKNIDVLFVGSVSPRRQKILSRVMDVSRVASVTGCYGRNLDKMIARAKIVLNLHYCDEPHPLEVVRLNYLMANGCCVVSERGWDDDENAQYAPGLVFTDDPADTVGHLLHANRAPIEMAARLVAESMPMQVPR